jgi:hypothetical protein
MIASKVTVCDHCNCKIYGEAYFAPLNDKKAAPFCCKYCAQAAAKMEVSK